MGRIPAWIVLLFLAFNPGLALKLAARGKPASWVEVRSPHFRVVTDAGEKRARNLAQLFEKIRTVFHLTFTNLNVDPAAPIVILATKNDADFNALNPIAWQQKGHAELAGYFQPSPDIYYAVVCLSLSDEGQNSYHVILHEYTHMLVHQYLPTIPLWLDEGLAEFYGYSEIYTNEVAFGVPAKVSLEILRQYRLLPLDTLFTVDHNSPCYNENNKTSIFYAESWALTHYLMTKDFKEKTRSLSNYMSEISRGTNPYTAAADAFGDLKALDTNLVSYVNQSSYVFLHMGGIKELPEKDLTAKELTPAESDAVRGDLMARNERYADAEATLEQALQEDPQNADAAFSMGFLEFQQDHEQEAQKWFTRAVELNAKDYLAHYYFAALAMKLGHVDPSASAQVEKSLQTAIQINPRFAPAYDALARFYGMQGENLDQAHLISLEAVELDPSNVYYYLTSASILLRMKRVEDAISVGHNAQKIAKSPAELAAVQEFLTSAIQYQADLAQLEKYRQASRQASTSRASTALPTSASTQENTSGTPPAAEPLPTPPLLHHADASLGARDMSDGTIQNVCCSGSSLDLDFQTPHQTLHLYTDNYFTVRFRAANFKPTGELYPCKQIQGMKAQITFYDIKGHSDEGEIIAVALMK